MSKEMWIIALGVVVVLAPQLGLPGSLRTLILTLCGAAIAIIGFMLRGEQLSRNGLSRRGSLPFVENDHTEGAVSGE